MKPKTQKSASRFTLYVSLLCFSLFPIPYSLAQQYGWKNITANLPDFPYDTIWNSQNEAIVCGLRGPCFISDNEGWIVSSNANDQGGCAVLHTTDGGESWEVSTVNTVCTDIQMLDQNTGYTGGYGGLLWKTTDGGQTWNFHGTTAVTIIDIEFPPQPSDTGYVSGMDGHVAWITPDGIIPLESGIFGHIETMSFPVSWQEGWFEGEGWGMIRHFVNNQWTGDQIHISGYFNAIDFVDSQNGWAAGDRIIHTTDGQTWVEQTNHPEMAGALFAVFFLDENMGWVAGSFGQVLKTTDGGESWSKEDLGAEKLFTGIQFTSPNNGYLVGNNKAIYKYAQISGEPETGGQGDIENDAVEVWPNPGRGQFKVQNSKFKVEIERIEVVDMYGNVLVDLVCDFGIGICLEFGAWDLEFDISRCPAGIYFLRISLENQTIVKKIIKI